MEWRPASKESQEKGACPKNGQGLSEGLAETSESVEHGYEMPADDGGRECWRSRS
jgi:hypothetical protein